MAAASHSAGVWSITNRLTNMFLYQLAADDARRQTGSSSGLSAGTPAWRASRSAWSLGIGCRRRSAAADDPEKGRNMTELAIPTCIADITPAWLTAALGTAPARVVDVCPERIGVGVGIMADEWRVTLTYDEPAPDQLGSVVVKLVSSAEENRTLANERNLYESEVRFYREPAAQTRTRVPRCFYARKAADAADFVVVMEDLSKLT